MFCDAPSVFQQGAQYKYGSHSCSEHSLYSYGSVTSARLASFDDHGVHLYDSLIESLAGHRTRRVDGPRPAGQHVRQAEQSRHLAGTPTARQIGLVGQDADGDAERGRAASGPLQLESRLVQPLNVAAVHDEHDAVRRPRVRLPQRTHLAAHHSTSCHKLTHVSTRWLAAWRSG